MVIYSTRYIEDVSHIYLILPIYLSHWNISFKSRPQKILTELIYSDKEKPKMDNKVVKTLN